MNYASIISGIIRYMQLRSIFQHNTVLLASITVELAESTVYSLHWHLSNIQKNYNSKNSLVPRPLSGYKTILKTDA